MSHKPGTTVTETGIYWCTVCKSPQSFNTGDHFPPCKNLCGRGNWEKVGQPEKPQPPQG